MIDAEPEKGDWCAMSRYNGPHASLGFELWRTFLPWQQELNALLKPFGLTQPQFAILAVCGWLAREGAFVAQRDISALTGMDKMHISQIVTRLERDGLIERRSADHDARVRSIFLTSSGLQTLRSTISIVETFDSQFFKKLGIERSLRMTPVEETSGAGLPASKNC